MNLALRQVLVALDKLCTTRVFWTKLYLLSGQEYSGQEVLARVAGVRLLWERGFTKSLNITIEPGSEVINASIKSAK